MERAAATWSGEWWRAGGGGTPWEGIVYDPELDYVYFGTGNATAWYRALRGAAPQDNLYVASILALRASDGEQVWHFQTTPGDNWDFDATQPLMFADLTIDGRATPRDHAGVEERLLLRARPRDGAVHLGRGVRGRRHVGDRARRRDRTADRIAERLCRLRRRDRLAKPERRAQLEPDGLQPGDRARLCAGQGRHEIAARARSRLEVRPGHVQPRPRERLPRAAAEQARRATRGARRAASRGIRSRSAPRGARLIRS